MDNNFPNIIRNNERNTSLKSVNGYGIYKKKKIVNNIYGLPEDPTAAYFFLNIPILSKSSAVFGTLS